MSAIEPVRTTLSCSVIVVNYNGGSLVMECLESILAADARGLDLDVVVVDNDSSDGSDGEIERRFPGVTLIRTGGNPGFGTAVNVGIRATTSDVVVLLNNDARAEYGFLQAITAPLREPGRLAAVSARITLTGLFAEVHAAEADYVDVEGRGWSRLPDGSSDESGVELINSTGLQVSKSGNGSDRSWLTPADDRAPAPSVFGFCGGGAAIRRSALDEVGLFDERLFMYYEDTDLSWRFRRFGWDIQYADGARTVHQHAASSGTTSQLFLVNNIRNRILVAAKNAPRGMLVLSIARTVASLIRSVVTAVVRRDPAARRRASATRKAMVQALVRMPGFLRSGRVLDRSAPVARNVISGWTIGD